MKKSAKKPEPAAAIKIVGLSKHFMGLHAIDDLSVDIPAGIATGLIGPNGSGKTTLMNVLSGIYPPTFGSIEVGGRAYLHIKPTDLRRFKIARTFQDGRLVGQLSVVDNLLTGISETGCWKSFADIGMAAYKDRLEPILEMIRLTAQRNKNAEELSYGQQKLLEMGRALIQDADIYFFDEPFTGLFPEMRKHVMEILNNLKKQRKTLVIIEHDMSLIESLCDHTIVLDYGKLLVEGTPEKVLSDAKVRAAYLGK